MKPSELCESAITLQAELDTFLYTLLIGNTEVPTEYPQSVWHLISCFGQDIIHSVTGGRQKPPSKYYIELIYMLNRCGHRNCIFAN